MCRLSRMFLFALIFSAALALQVSAAESSCAFRAKNGALIELDAKLLEEALGLGGGVLSGVTVVSLPDPSVGRLICEGVEVERYDYLSRKELEWLVYEPFLGESAARMTLLPDSANGDCAVVALYSSDRDAPLSLTVSADFLAWRQAQNRYWAHVAALAAPLPV